MKGYDIKKSITYNEKFKTQQRRPRSKILTSIYFLIKMFICMKYTDYIYKWLEDEYVEDRFREFCLEPLD